MESNKLTFADQKAKSGSNDSSPRQIPYALNQVNNNKETADTSVANSVNTACENNEEQLECFIARIIDQDQPALNLLFKAMSVRVHSLALRITGNSQIAEEVTEDTFFQVWRQAPRFDSTRGTVTAWILTIARSRALDARRSIPPFDELKEFDYETINQNNTTEEPPDLLAMLEQNQCLHDALKNIDPLPRQLISLSFFRGLSHEEIALYAELPLGTVKSHIRRAIITLREVLDTQQNLALHL